MKPRHLLILFPGMNLALAAALFVLWRNPPAPTPALLTQATAPETPGVTTNTVSTAPVTANSPFQWRMIESEDYHKFIANLRAVGCPERTIRDIIVVEIDEYYARTNRFIPFVPPPWLNAEHRRAGEHDRAAKLAAVRAEKRALVKELIGYEWDNHANEVWQEDFEAALLLGFLPDPKAPQLMAIVEGYKDLADGVKEEANFILIDEDHAKLRKLYDDLVAEASQLLAPAEREELELRVQAGVFLSANNIHWDGVAITGAELREFVRLSKAYQDTFKNEFLGLRDPPEKVQARRKAAFERQVETLLGPARFADYQRAQDFNFHAMAEFTQERHLPIATAIKIYNARNEAEVKAGQMKGDKSLSPEEQAAALAVLKSTTAGTVSSTLGKAYRDYLSDQGQWLEELVLQPAPTAQDAK